MAPLPARRRPSQGRRLLDRGVSPLLVRSRRRSRAPPRPHASIKTSQQERKATGDRAPAANAKEKINENQSDKPICGRPGKGTALLYRSPGFREEDRLQPGAISLADRGLGRGAGGYGAAVGVEQQSRGQSLPAGIVPTKPTGCHVLYQRP